MNVSLYKAHWIATSLLRFFFVVQERARKHTCIPPDIFFWLWKFGSREAGISRASFKIVCVFLSLSLETVFLVSLSPLLHGRICLFRTPV
jgi:hypothetical protein